jgi:hypothetical protein
MYKIYNMSHDSREDIKKAYVIVVVVVVVVVVMETLLRKTGGQKITTKGKMDDVEDFLKREQMALGADAALFQSDDHIPLSTDGVGAVNANSKTPSHPC